MMPDLNNLRIHLVIYYKIFNIQAVQSIPVINITINQKAWLRDC